MKTDVNTIRMKRFLFLTYCSFNRNNNYSPQLDHKIYLRPRTACSWPVAQNFPSKGKKFWMFVWFCHCFPSRKTTKKIFLFIAWMPCNNNKNAHITTGYSTCPYLYLVPRWSCGANLWQHQMGFGRDSSRGLFAQTLNLMNIVSWVTDKDRSIVLSAVVGGMSRIQLRILIISRNPMIFSRSIPNLYAP